MKARHLIPIAAVTFFVSLLVQAPAAVLYGWTLGRSEAAPVRLFGVEGTLFAGSAVQAARGNQALLTELQWRLQPLELALGRLSYRLNAGAAPLVLDGEFAVGLGGTRVEDLRASGEVRALATAVGQAFVPMTGQLGLELDHLRLRDGWPSTADGRIELVGLSWALSREPIPLGDYEASVRTEGEDIVALVSTLRGVVDVNGDARLHPDRSFEVNLQLRPRPDAPAMVVNLLRSLGAPDAQGYYRLRHSGMLA